MAAFFPVSLAMVTSYAVCVNVPVPVNFPVNSFAFALSTVREKSMYTVPENFSVAEASG